MNVKQQPDSLSLSMNLKKFVISAKETVSFVLKKDTEEIVAHKYEPGADGIIEMDIRDIVHSRLSYMLKDSGEVYQQTELAANFTAIIDTTEVTFRVVRGGVDTPADSAANFLTQNFLTWQPSVKPVTYYSPEFLTYYAVGAGKVKLHAYFTDANGIVSSEKDYIITDLVPSMAYTIPLQYSVVAGWLGNKLPAYYDVWVESTAGYRLTYIQRYYAEDMRSHQEQWVLFENSLGGLDTFRAYGSDTLNAEHTHNLAEIDEVSQEYRVDTERKHQKNTGYLNKEEARWLLDFFPSQKKYLYTGSYLRRIVVTESNVTGKLQEAPVSYTFTYKYADSRPLLNLPRTDVPADVLDITIPEVGSFTVPPRLAEVPRLPLSEGALFPVQNPYSEKWGTTTAGMIGNFISKIFAVYKFFKGYFSISKSLILKYPTPQEGWYAFVGIPWPGTVYECSSAGIWEDTGVAPLIGDDIFIALFKRHIDGTTIYWDDTNRVIKSHGGGGDTVYTITVGINTSDIGRCAISTTGEVVSTSLSSDGSTYTILAAAGGTVKIQILPEDGYQVQELDIDAISQGALSEYTFENLDADHTMHVWMELSEETPIEYLTRSDLPGMYYSRTQDVFDALKADYPRGLTQDVTITCVKPAREKRTSGIWVASLEEWNIRTMFTLTIDGGDFLLYDGKSLGCLMFRQVDNVIIKNTGFVNFANSVEATTPDACFAVYCWGGNNFHCSNLYIGNCEFDGSSTIDGKMATSTLSCMNVDNVTLVGCSCRKNYGYTFTITDCGMVSMVRNTIRVEHSLGVVSHPSVLEMNNSYRLVFEDNDISGDIRESYVNLNNVDYIYFRRNKLHDGGGEALNVASLLGTRELVIESNLFMGMLVNPVGGWMKHYINPGTVSLMRVCNNTFYMSGDFYEQYAIRFGNIGELYLYNNIVVKAADKAVHAFFFESIGKLHSGSNLYQFEYNPANGTTSGIIITTTAPDSPVIIPQNISKYLSKIQKLGYEQNSNVVDTSIRLLSSNYAITEQYNSVYKANDDYIPFADLNYKRAASLGNSCGCYNLAGTAIDENQNLQGYTGYNLEADATFSADNQYAAMAESILMLTHNTLNRNRLIKYSVIGPAHQYLLLGKYCMLAASPILDADGEYLEDESYTIKVVQDD